MSSSPSEKHSEAIYRWDKLIEKLNKLSSKTDLSQETQDLIRALSFNWDTLHRAGIKRAQLGFTVHQKTEFATLNNSRKNFQEDLKKLKEQLINLPYSKDKFVNSLLKNLDKLLEKLAVFFRNKLTVSVDVYIHSEPEPHKYHFFHPYTSVNNRVEDFLKAFMLAKL